MVWIISNIQIISSYKNLYLTLMEKTFASDIFSTISLICSNEELFALISTMLLPPQLHNQTLMSIDARRKMNLGTLHWLLDSNQLRREAVVLQVEKNNFCKPVNSKPAEQSCSRKNYFVFQVKESHELH